MRTTLFNFSYRRQQLGGVDLSDWTAAQVREEVGFKPTQHVACVMGHPDFALFAIPFARNRLKAVRGAFQRLLLALATHCAGVLPLRQNSLPLVAKLARLAQ